MGNWSIQKELNHVYVVFEEDCDRLNKDFRFRMIKENPIDEILSPDIRNINGEYKTYYDITDLESLEKTVQLHGATCDDVKEVLKALLLLSTKLEKIFCEENTVILSPQFIFKNRLTDSYVFICHPEEENIENNYQVELISYFVNHIQVDQTNHIEGLFEVYDMVMEGNKSFKTLYEKLISTEKNPQENEDQETNVNTVETVNDDYKICERENAVKMLSEKYYIPSLQESLAGLFLLSGTVSIFVYIYLNWI